MKQFDFHHHHKNNSGIYNLKLIEKPVEKLFSAGIHPNDSDQDKNQIINWLENSIAHENCRAVGECGLDSTVLIPEKRQKEIFLMQIEAANQYRKPLIIHCVRKYDEILRMKKWTHVSMIIHGFNKNEKIAADLLQNGFYLSFGKALLTSLSLQQIFQTVPVDRYFLETDDSEINISEIYAKAAELKKCAVEEISGQICTNLKKINVI